MVLGWKYVDAKEEGQKYKIGKFILETKRVVGVQTWEDEQEEEEDVDPAVGERVLKTVANGECVWEDADVNRRNDIPVDEIVFDSEDEEECEDLFSGSWDPVVVAKRRGRKIANLRKASLA